MLRASTGCVDGVCFVQPVTNHSQTGVCMDSQSIISLIVVVFFVVLAFWAYWQYDHKHNKREFNKMFKKDK